MATRMRTTPRKQPRQPRAKATVEAILDATAQILVREGYDRASTNRIAQAAGVSIGSLYQYFPSKEALVAALIERYHESCAAKFRDRLVELAASPVPVVAEEMIRLIVDVKSLNPQLERVLMEQVPRVGRMGKIRDLEDRLSRLVKIYLETRSAELRPLNFDTAAFILVKCASMLAHEIAVEHPAGLKTSDLIEEFKRLLLGYVGYEGAAPRPLETALRAVSASESLG